MDRKTIKQIGKANMKRQWGELLLAIVLTAVAESVASLLTVGIGAFVVAGPLAYGMTHLYYRSTQGEQVGQMLLLRGFKDKFGESFLAGMLLEIIKAIPLIVGFLMAFSAITAAIGSMIMGFSSYGSGYSSGYGGGYGTGAAAAGFGGILMFLITIVLIVACIFIYLGLFLTVYILVREKDSTAVEALKKSWAMMKGQKGRVFVFMLSFLGWFILGAITFGILFIWVLPYYKSSEMILMNDIYENSNVKGNVEFNFRDEVNDIKDGFGDMRQKAGGMDEQKKAPEVKVQKAAGAAESVAEQTDAIAEQEEAPEVKAQQPQAGDEETHYCPKCGAVVRSSAKFCNNCGTPVQ